MVVISAIMEESAMRHVLFPLLACSSLAYGANLDITSAPETGRKVGVGVGYSGAAGPSLYAETSRTNFVQAGLSYATSAAYAVTADYAFGYHNAISSNPSMTPFWGIGAVYLHDQDNYWTHYTPKQNDYTSYIGARIPLGINVILPRTPVQLAAELAPSLVLTPASYGYLQGGVSARVLF